MSKNARDWSVNRGNNLVSYKLRDPQVDFTHAKNLVIDLETDRPSQSLRPRLIKNKDISGVREPQLSFSVARQINEPGRHRIVVSPADFKEKSGETMSDWSNVYTLNISIYSGIDKANLDLLTTQSIKSLTWE